MINILNELETSLEEEFKPHSFDLLNQEVILNELMPIRYLIIDNVNSHIPINIELLQDIEALQSRDSFNSLKQLVFGIVKEYLKTGKYEPKIYRIQTSFEEGKIISELIGD
jgi:hypothetical protein